MATTESSPIQEEEIRRAAELKEWLEGKIQELEVELARLREMMQLVDTTLRRSSFVPAAQLRPSTPTHPTTPQMNAPTPPAVASGRDAKASLSASKGPSSAASAYHRAVEAPRPLRRTKDGMLLATAYVGADRVDVVPSGEVHLSPATPPFESFFINRILKGYESKDREAAQSGALQSDKLLQFDVVEADGRIEKITVANYRDTARLNEILSTATWAFTRMLEKK